MTTRAAKLAHTVSVGGTFEDGVIQANEVAGISTVATTGSYTDLTNKPTIPSLTGYATQTYVTTAITNLINGAPTAFDTLKEISDQLATDESAVATIVTTLGTKANTSSLATVATTGSYSDLTNKPTLGDTLPTQTGNNGKYLQTNGSTVSWQAAATLSAVNTNTDSITANYSISTGTNAQSVGPITQSAGTTLTIAAGQRWLII
jgi:hypothetical protein